VPDERVVHWLRRHEQQIAVDPVILGEVRFGILILPSGKRRKKLEHWFDEGIQHIHCLPWEAATGLRWAELLASLRRSGHAMPIKDSLIAATALLHGLTMVTRNQTDFEKAGVRITDPFV
jgi:toxin FitB